MEFTRKKSRLVTPFAALLLSAAGTFAAWQYVPAENLRLFLIASGLIVDLLLFGVLYLSASSSELKNFLKYLEEAGIKLEEEKLKSEDERRKLEAVIENMPFGVFLAKVPGGDPLIINRACVELLGSGFDPRLKRADRRIYELIKEDGTSYPKEELPLAATLRDGQPNAKSDIFVRRPDGSTMALRVSSAPVRNYKGVLIAAVVVFENMTKEQQIDRAKTEFVSLASHQLRTPLSTINWYAEMLLDGDAGALKGEQKEYLEEVYHASKRMVELVNALLNVSRIELGTFAIEPEPTDISKVAEGVWKELARKITEKKLKIGKLYEKKSPPISADPKLVRILFQNLLSNAVKYTPKNGSIELEIKRDDKNMSIRVTDTGYGIPKAQQSKIFSKLFRADNVREKETDGTGLGLYIVKAVVERSGGKIWFESKEGKGSSFYVVLPLSGMKKKEGAKGLTSGIY